MVLSQQHHLSFYIYRNSFRLNIIARAYLFMLGGSSRTHSFVERITWQLRMTSQRQLLRIELPEAFQYQLPL